MVLGKLPMECRLEWPRNSLGKEGDLDYLLSSLQEELKRRDRASCYTSRERESTTNRTQPPPFQPHRPAAATLYSAVPTAPVHCVLCSGSHPISQCSQFLQLAYCGRRDECYLHRLCYACLNTGHLQSSCTEKCATCGGQHHRLLCNTAVTPEAPTRGVNVNAPSFSQSSTYQNIRRSGAAPSGGNMRLYHSRNQILPQLLQVTAKDKRGKPVSITVLLDTGSDCSYARQEVINNLSPCCTGVESVAFTAFGSLRPVASQILGIYNVDLFADIKSCVTVNVIEIEQICAPVCHSIVFD